MLTTSFTPHQPMHQPSPPVYGGLSIVRNFNSRSRPSVHRPDCDCYVSCWLSARTPHFTTDGLIDISHRIRPRIVSLTTCCFFRSGCNTAGGMEWMSTSARRGRRWNISLYIAKCIVGSGTSSSNANNLPGKNKSINNQQLLFLISSGARKELTRCKSMPQWSCVPKRNSFCLSKWSQKGVLLTPFSYLMYK